MQSSQFIFTGKIYPWYPYITFVM